MVLKNVRVRLPSWSRTYLAPSYAAGEKRHVYPLEVLAQVLGGGSTSRLYRKLVVDRGIASSAGAWYSGDGLDYGEFGVYVSPKAGGDIEMLEKAVVEELAAAIKEGFRPADIDRAKKLISAQAIYARDGIRAGPNAIGQAFTQGQTIEDVEAWPERISAVTSDQVMAAAKAVLIVESSVTSILLPEAAK